MAAKNEPGKVQQMQNGDTERVVQLGDEPDFSPDPLTRRLLEDILSDEQEHAEALSDWLSD
jgi:hypothetical protein